MKRYICAKCGEEVSNHERLDTGFLGVSHIRPGTAEYLPGCVSAPYCGPVFEKKEEIKNDRFLKKKRKSKMTDKKHSIVRTYCHHDNKSAVVVEVSCDSEACARTKEFVEFVDNLALSIFASSSDSMQGVLFSESATGDKTVVEDILGARNKFKENIVLETFYKIGVYYK